MKRLTLKRAACLLAVLCIVTQFSFTGYRAKTPAMLPVKANNANDSLKAAGALTGIAGRYANLYDSMRLSATGLSRQAFNYAVKGYSYLVATGKIKNDGVLSIIDFTLPSSNKRLFVIDLKACCMVFNTYVSHGRNSGKAVASEFSNTFNSFKSSLGFYVTSGTYKGKHGYSLRLEGEEEGINDNALNRGIVMHCAPYVSESFIKRQGYLGRSEGCPAVPAQLYKPIIEKIKDGSCLFMYSTDAFYLNHSAILNKAALT
jgi:hypothetical protein